MQTNDLLTYLFDGQSNILVQPMATWLASSRRFAAFATTFRDKIRKKLRLTRNQKGMLDLQLELETAYLLLQERALNLAYEPEHSKGTRSPDFAVTFTTRLTFMLEVTRVQIDKNIAGETREKPPAPLPGIMQACPPSGARLAASVIGKLSQLLPQSANILLVGIEAPHLTLSDIRNAMFSLQQRAERNDLAFLQGYGFFDRADFFRHYQRLSEVLVRVPHSEAANSIVPWFNPQSKHPLPSRVRTVLHRSLTSQFESDHPHRGLTMGSQLSSH